MREDEAVETVRLQETVAAADRLDAALDAGGTAPAPAPATGDELAALLSVAAEITRALARPLLSDSDRRRIHARAVDLAEQRAQHGLRLSWPQLAQQLGSRPAVVGGGVAAAALAVVGLAVLRERRGHGGQAAASAA